MRKNQFDKGMTLILQWNDIARIFWVNTNTLCMISDIICFRSSKAMPSQALCS